MHSFPPLVKPIPPIPLSKIIHSKKKFPGLETSFFFWNFWQKKDLEKGGKGNGKEGKGEEGMGGEGRGMEMGRRRGGGKGEGGMEGKGNVLLGKKKKWRTVYAGKGVGEREIWIMHGGMKRHSGDSASRYNSSAMCSGPRSA